MLGFDTAMMTDKHRKWAANFCTACGGLWTNWGDGECPWCRNRGWDSIWVPSGALYIWQEKRHV